jgi:Tfp pilus assembly protein PilF
VDRKGGKIMENINAKNDDEEMRSLCQNVRELVGKGDIQGGEHLVTKAMGNYPHAPQPHNLLGVLLEKRGDHLLAMKHFRAAWALEPTYLPARQNLDRFGTFFSTGHYAYDESDCPAERPNPLAVVYGENGAGHVIKKR